MLPKFYLAVVTLLLSWTSLASPSAGVEARINWWKLGFQYANHPAAGWFGITFLIFVAGVIYYTRKPLGLYLEARAREISHAINEAKIAKEDAHAQLRRYDEQLIALDAQVASMREDFRWQGEQEKTRMALDAKKLSERIMNETAAAIKAETIKVSGELRAELASAIIKNAMEKIASGAPIAEDSLRADFVRDMKTVSH